MEKVTFFDEEEKLSVEFFVVEETQLNGMKYLLVTEEETEDADAYILREIKTDDDQITYEMVEDDLELTALGKIFAELLDEDTNVEY